MINPFSISVLVWCPPPDNLFNDTIKVDIYKSFFKKDLKISRKFMTFSYSTKQLSIGFLKNDTISIWASILGQSSYTNLVFIRTMGSVGR